MEVCFWGVRGSVACCAPEYTLVGGHTSCVSVQVGDQFIIFDAGTGLRDLGVFLENQRINRATLCLSHGHYDHVIGLPFFQPIWRSSFHLTVIAGTLEPYGGTQEFFHQHLFAPPFFPVNGASIGAECDFIDIRPGMDHQLSPEISLKTISLNHPGGAIGYRLEYDQKSLCYITDHEHSNPEMHQAVTEFIHETDLLIYDATFTDEEYQQHKGWGHSTWQEGICLARTAKVKYLALYHHDPSHTDEIMAHIEKDARAISPSTIIARQGMKIRID